MKAITPRQQQALNIIRASITTIGVPPSHIELARALGVKPPVASRYIWRLERKGLIKCQRFTPRGIVIIERAS